MGEAFDGDEESERVDDDESVDDDDESVDRDGDLEVPTTSVAYGGSVSVLTRKPQSTRPTNATKELATV